LQDDTIGALPPDDLGDPRLATDAAVPDVVGQQSQRE
jgi:hypothetical protein